MAEGSISSFSEYMLCAKVSFHLRNQEKVIIAEMERSAVITLWNRVRTHWLHC